MKCNDSSCVRCFYTKKTRRFKREDFLTDLEIKRWWDRIKDKPFVVLFPEFKNEILKGCIK